MMELVQGSILERATRLEIGSGLQLTQNADGIPMLDFNPASALTLAAADARYLQLTGGTLSGSLAGTQAIFSTFVRAGSGANGYVQLATGDASHTGYLEWFRPSLVRVGYMGYELTSIVLQLENADFIVKGSHPMTYSMSAGHLTIDRPLGAANDPAGHHLRLVTSGVPQLSFGSDINNVYIQSWASKPIWLNNQGNAVFVGGSGLFVAGGGSLKVDGFIYAGLYAGPGVSAGDIVARRSATTGVYYFTDSNTKYLYYDGTNFNFSGGQVVTPSNFVLANIAGSGLVGQYTGLWHTRESYMGYSTGYKVVILGDLNSPNRLLSLGVDLTGNPSGLFSGNGTEIVMPNISRIITPNVANNGYNTRIIFGSAGDGTLAGTTWGITGSAIGTFSLNSTAVNGGYMVWQKSGVDRFYIGESATVSGVGTGYDIWGGLDVSIYAGSALRLRALSAGGGTLFGAWNTTGSSTFAGAATFSSTAGFNGVSTFNAGVTFTSGVTFASTVAMGAGAWSGTGSITLTGNSFFTNNWFRSTGNTGWFSSDYAVGIYAIAAGTVRTYNGASFVSEGALAATTYTRTTTYFYADQNYGSGMVGLYDPSHYQLVYAMGDAYKPNLAGTSITSFYGLAWIYDYLTTYINATGRQLEHSLALYVNGVVRSVIGMNGIWTSGNIWSATIDGGARQLLGAWFINDGSTTARQIVTAMVSSAAPTTETGPGIFLYLRT